MSGDDWLPDGDGPVRFGRQRVEDANRARAHTIVTESIRVALLQTKRVQFWPNPTGFDEKVKRPYGLGRGGPDQAGFLKGLARFFGVETKTGKARLSHEQILWHAEAKKNGAFVTVAHSPEEALTALERASKFDVHVVGGVLAIKWKFFE